MSKSASPMAVGSFVLGSILLAIAAILYIGTISFATGNPRLVIFFDESVAGLEVGGKVKYRGITVGAVKNISLRLENQDPDDTHIPVIIELDLQVLRRLGSTVTDDDREYSERLKDFVDRGLRAQLQLGSVLTGQSYIQLDIHETEEPPVFVQSEANQLYPEIPSIPSPFAALGQSTSDMIAKVATLPFDELSEQLVSLVEGINVLVSKAQKDNVTDALVQALKAFRDRVSDPKIDENLTGLKETLLQIKTSVASADEGLSPIADDIQKMSSDMEATLVTIRGGFSQMEKAGIQVESMLTPESAFRYRLEEVLIELAATSSALRDLAEQLERNPQSLLTGKAEQTP